MPDKVKCANCGFLAFRETSRSRQLREAEDGPRRGGMLPMDAKGGFYVDEYPVCFVRAINFHQLIGQSCIEENRRTELRKPRDCDQFIAWQQGFTPREHYEMRLLDEERRWQKQKEEADRAWQLQRDAGDKHWREQQEAVAEKRHQDNLRVVAESTRWNVRVALASAFVGVLGTLLAVWVAKWIGTP